MKCQKCGNDFEGRFCPNCGTAAPEQTMQEKKKVRCPKCESENVSITIEQTSAKTSHNKRGCLWSIGRAFLILCTCGLWLLVGRSKGKSKTKFKNETIAICQNCGHKWNV